MTVDANILGDVHEKIVFYRKMIPKILDELGECADPKAFAAFFSDAQGRMLYGGLKYGPGSWKHIDLLAELKQELLDVANYSMLELLKGGHTASEEAWLISFIADAFVMWQDLDGYMEGELR